MQPISYPSLPLRLPPLEASALESQLSATPHVYSAAPTIGQVNIVPSHPPPSYAEMEADERQHQAVPVSASAAASINTTTATTAVPAYTSAEAMAAVVIPASAPAYAPAIPPRPALIDLKRQLSDNKQQIWVAAPSPQSVAMQRPVVAVASASASISVQHQQQMQQQVLRADLLADKLAPEVVVEKGVSALESDRVCESLLQRRKQAMAEFTEWFERRALRPASLDGEFFRLVEEYRIAQYASITHPLPLLLKCFWCSMF